ncbi:cation diffusion facilitator family transporter [Fundicoccus culcitae]|uniref:Cation diffusion facilitator family transporter n=1 Tax=Fundicoccus culcitae TaxID=2969821 RepID=A0ABY5P2V5_9LACT|nr:cation diffusion facilitator family transporter [Fundicoccus culcitae]UUX33054.1 cation diffusion facilitator family transporter [Fundicoccus culcitae]
MSNNSKASNDPTNEASKGSFTGIIVYLILAAVKIVSGTLFNSSTMLADGLNNLTDTVSSITIFIGLRLSNRPADNNHHFGHDKYEPLASFLISLLMFTVGYDIIASGVRRFISQEFLVPDTTIIWITLASSVVLYFTYLYISRLAKKTNSLGLSSTAKDMRNDILISLSTVVSTLASTNGYPIVDTIVSIGVGLVIIKSAFEVFRDSTFILSDGFDEERIQQYKELILKHPKVIEVSGIRGRLSGQMIYLDVTIKIDGKMSVNESHHVTEEIEHALTYKYGVHDTDVHVEPI